MSQYHVSAPTSGNLAGVLSGLPGQWVVHDFREPLGALPIQDIESDRQFDGVDVNAFITVFVSLFNLASVLEASLYEPRCDIRLLRARVTRDNASQFTVTVFDSDIAVFRQTCALSELAASLLQFRFISDFSSRSVSCKLHSQASLVAVSRIMRRLRRASCCPPPVVNSAVQVVVTPANDGQGVGIQCAALSSS